MNNGYLSTYVSNIGLLFFAVVGANESTTNLGVQTIIIGSAIVLAYLDIKYPRYKDKVDSYITKLRQCGIDVEKNKVEDSGEDMIA